MSVEKKKWLPVKQMLVTYLAISKMLYWINVISTAQGLEGMWRAISERLLYRDIVLIIFIVFIYIFEYQFIEKQQKWTGISAQIKLNIVGCAMLLIILTTYVWVTSLIRSVPFDVVLFLRGHMLNYMVIYSIIAGTLTAKESYKKKEAAEYALDIQCTNIKCEMLECLLAEGVLSKEEFDKQRAKL